MKQDCVYLGEALDSINRVRRCQLFGSCVLSDGESKIAACDICRRKLTLESPKFPSEWEDPLKVTDRHGMPATCLRGMLAGRSAFLACGGPSAKLLPLERLNERGTWTLTVNNMGGHGRFRPQAMVCTDPPSKFSHSIWLDPAIMKFIPTPKFARSRGALRERQGDGTFTASPVSTATAPNVWGFGRRKWITCDDSFFLHTEAANGNYDDGVRRTGEEKTICTMLSAMRILRYLGASRVFLIGVDFFMDPAAGKKDNYAFAEDRDCDAITKNNDQFRVVNGWLCRLQEAGVFKRFGIEFFNCNPVSALRAFPHVPFDLAIADVIGKVEKTPNLDGWYFK